AHPGDGHCRGVGPCLERPGRNASRFDLHFPSDQTSGSVARGTCHHVVRRRKERGKKNQGKGVEDLGAREISLAPGSSPLNPFPSFLFTHSSFLTPHLNL